MIACTSTSDVAYASDRAWLKPSATRSRMNASRSSWRRPVSPSVSRASSPVSSQVSGTGVAVLIGCGRRDADRHRAGLHLDARAASPSCGRRRRARTAILRSKRMSNLRASAVCTNGDARPLPTAVRASVARPLPAALGGDDADLEQAVVGPGVGERGDAADHLADVADEHAARLAVEPLARRRRGRAPDTRAARGSSRRSRCTRRVRAGPSARRRRRGSSRASSPAPAITANCSPLIAPTSSLRRRAVQPDLDRRARCPSGSRGWSRRGSRCRPARSRSSRRSRPARRCSAAPCRRRPRRTPGRRRPRAPLRLLRRLLALRHLEPERVVDAGRREWSRSSPSPPPSDLPEWATTATRGHAVTSRRRSTATHVRTTNSATARHTRPSDAPLATSLGKCMPR